MDAGLGDPVRIAGQVLGSEGPHHPAQVFPIDAVAGEGTPDQSDDGHPTVAEPAVQVLAPHGARPYRATRRRLRVQSPVPNVVHFVAAGRMSPVLFPAPAGFGRRLIMTTAVIVDAVRTAGGKRNGKLRNWHAVDLASETLKALQQRNNLDPAVIDDVIMGCVMQVSEQSLNVGRNAVLAAGWPESVPATTIDRQCGSSQQAIHFAAQGVIAGAYDIAVAAGVESMTHTPMGSSVVRDFGFPFGPRMMGRYTDNEGHSELKGQGIGAEMIADQWGISREELDAFAVQSHQRAARATAEGRFENELVPVAVHDDEGKDTDEIFATDEGIRPDSSVESLANLKPAFKEDGKVTAGNSSQITDGASAVLIMSEEKANALGLRPRARFHAFALAGVDPVTMLTGPIPATTTVLERAKLTLDDIDAVEINEAFASVVLAWEK